MLVACAPPTPHLASTLKGFGVAPFCVGHYGTTL